MNADQQPTPASLASGPDETAAIRELETWIDGNVPYTLRPTLWRLVQSALRAALSENARLKVDSTRLDDISRAGASTRVFVRALENKANPRTVVVAAVRIPMGAQSFIESERSTLRQAIDSASGNESVREYRAKLDAAASGERAKGSAL